MKLKQLLSVVLTIAIALTANAAEKQFTLVIDAGHGGHDAGAIGSFSKEKNINLNVALAFGRYVERNCPDVKVIYTRKTDVFIPLHTRADIANKNKADLFVSIHTNSLPAGRIARGMETYTLGMHRANDNLDVAKRENSVILIEKDYKQRYEGFDPRSSESYIMFEFMQDKNMEQSVELARFVQKRTCATAGRANKGVKQAGFLVLRATSMPSCLIELGFISTADEERYLNSDEGVDKLGRGIYQAFADYKKKYDHRKKDATAKNEKSVGTAPAVAETKVVEQPQPTETPKQNGSKQTRRRSRAAQELADAREGRVAAESTAQDKKAADVDSVVIANPIDERPAEPQPATADKQTQEEKTVVTKEQPKEEKPKVAATEPKQKETTKPDAAEPIFKVQILASTTQQALNSNQLKGQQDVDMYQEGGFYKYTVGASANYQEIYQLRKSLLEKFPEAFIIAFRNGQKIDVRQAIQEYRNKKTK